MPHHEFTDIETWIFDLDNTLYPPRARLFDEISERMVLWIMRELDLGRADADVLRAQYWSEHGTTLAGLMAEHQIDPWPFLTFVHDIDFSPLEPAPNLAATIRELPGRAIVYTNGDTPYARKVLEALGLVDVFEAVYGIEHSNWQPKPAKQAFQMILEADGANPARSAMFEDELRNLAAPFAMGMRTIHVAPTEETADHVHRHTDDLEQFLQDLLTGRIAPAPGGP